MSDPILSREIEHLTGRLDAIIREQAGDEVFLHLHEIRDLAIAARQHEDFASLAAKRALIDADRHAVIESAHPSPLSAYRGFFGSRPFSRTNAALQAAGAPSIDWRLEPQVRAD